MKHRIKLTGSTLKTRADLEAAMSDIRDWTIERMTLFAEFEAATKAVDDAHRTAIDALGEKLEARTEQIKSWAEANADAFAGKRSIDTIHGTLGWRMGQWKCDKLDGWIWKAGRKTKAGSRIVLDALKKRFASLFIRTVEEPDLESIIAARGELTAEQLGACGIAILQVEAFYVDPKIEDTENRQIAS